MSHSASQIIVGCKPENFDKLYKEIDSRLRGTSIDENYTWKPENLDKIKTIPQNHYGGASDLVLEWLEKGLSVILFHIYLDDIGWYGYDDISECYEGLVVEKNENFC